MLNIVKKFSCHIFLVLVPFFSFADNLQVPSIEFSNLNAALSSGDTIIIDARPAVFYELGHIPNAASLPLVNFEASFDRVNKEYNLKKFKQIIVYCSDRDCDDSDKLAKKLQAKGLDNIVVYKGGWQEWEKCKNENIWDNCLLFCLSDTCHGVWCFLGRFKYACI